MKKTDNNNNQNQNKTRLPIILLLVVLIACAFFIMSDASFVKSARDSLMQKLGYEAIDNGGEGTENGEDENSRKRIDIGICREDNILAAIVECKAYSLRSMEAPFVQALDYVRALRVPSYFVTDGVWLDGYRYAGDTDQFVPMEKILTYEELL